MNPCTLPEHTHDWLTPEELARHAQAAYTAARKEMNPPEGESFIESEIGLEWASRDCFREALLRHLETRIHSVYGSRVIHKSTAACAEAERPSMGALEAEGSCGPCG